tara:strand:+ start:33 stop:470 length:438 start_codon:yes stop_codon:yes gene_type:complete
MKTLRLIFLVTISFFLVVFSLNIHARTIQIEFTADDSYSVEVAKIDVGDTIEWLPSYEGHNVEFLGGPDFNLLPEKSDLNAFHSVTFNLPGVYLYHCTPHGNMGMIGLIIVGNDLNNLKDIEGIELSSIAKSVLERFITIAKINP